MARQFSILACICGASSNKHAREWPPQESTEFGAKPRVQSVSNHNNLTCSANSGHQHDQPDFDVRALIKLQRALGSLRGAWLPRLHAVLSTIAVFLDATDISFYGVSSFGKAGVPACFILLATEFGNASTSSSKDADGVVMPGLEVWPASERTKPEGQQGCVDESKMVNMQLTKREACQRLMPSMLDRMVATQAPVVQRLPTVAPEPPRNPGNPLHGGLNAVPPATKDPGTVEDVTALVPLTVGDRIMGALWIVRFDQRARAADGSVGAPKPLQSPNTSTTAVANLGVASRGSGVAVGVATSRILTKGAATVPSPLSLSPPPPPHSPLPSPCPALLSSPQALQQLSLSTSMCLLGSDVGLIASVCENLHQISAATSIQHLVGALSDALGGHMRERFLLEPRVFTALVPEAASAVGLMFSRPSPATPAISHSVGKFTRGGASGGASGMLGSGPGGGLEAAALYGDGRRDGPRPQSSRVATMGGKESNSLGARPISDLSSCLAHAASMATTAAAITGSGSIDRDLGGMHRTTRGPGLQRVVALTQSDLAHVDASLCAGGGGGAHLNSGSFMALRVKPFPLAQTLLRYVVRKVVAGRGVGNNSSFESDNGGGSDYRTCRARAIEVENCALHLQDAKKPSRDILFLIANSGAAAPLSTFLPSGGVFTASTTTASCGGCASASNSFTSGRRAVSSLLLLVLPAGDGKAMIGLYVTFPQTLPQQLLRQARRNLLDILEVLYPAVARKLTTDLAVELDTLANAAPGSYAVVEAPEVDDCAGANGSDAAATMDDENVLRATESKILLQTVPDNERTPDRMVPIYSPLVQSFLYDSRGGDGGGPGSSTAHGGAGGSAMGATRSLNLTDTIASPNVGENMVGMTSLLSVRESALGASIAAGCTTVGLTRSTVIHMEELDLVQSTMRAQMPLLVASMQNSINNARVEAVMAAAAAELNRSRGSFAAPNAAPFGADNSDLSQLELHTQLGHGGSAVVFKGNLGTLDCAVKLMEMPDVDGVEATSGSHKTVPTLEWVEAGDADGKDGCKDGKDSGDESENGSSLAARRAMLRNAMELAAMTSISHPNIMQVYSTFSNVTLGRRAKPDGSDHFYLKAVDDGASNQPDAPPICVAIVCEWCDKGCLGSALHKRTFPAMALQPNSAKKLSSQSSGLSCKGEQPRQQPQQQQPRLLDYKGILMTLLDVAMALRHLHTHNLIHRDVKPANVLLKGNVVDARGFTAKLADFGFVTLLNQPGDEKSGGEPFTWVDETCGTVTHMAPECWRKPARLGASCDVYSFGILMWEMTAGGIRPYPEVHPSNITRVVKRGMRPMFEDSVPAQYRFLAQRCWTADPLSRPRTSELVTEISQLLSRM